MVGGGRKPMFRTIALAAIATFGGCGEGKRIPAVGPGSEIVVMSSPGLRPIRGQVLEILSREVRVVHFEPTFDTVEADLADHSFYKTRKLLFAVGTPEDADLAKLLRGATGTQTRSQFPGLWIVTEPFSAGQILFVLSGTVEALREVLAERPDDLLAVVEEAAVTLMLTNLFRAGEVPGARDDMLAAWGWGVRVPPNWVVDQRYARERFVRVWRDSPVESSARWRSGSPVVTSSSSATTTATRSWRRDRRGASARRRTISTAFSSRASGRTRSTSSGGPSAAGRSTAPTTIARTSSTCVSTRPIDPSDR
jgi:hypothetical protein